MVTAASIRRGIELQQKKSGSVPIEQESISTIAIVGTASQGRSDEVIKIDSPDQVFKEFGEMPAKDDNRFTLVKNISAIYKQVKGRPTILAVRTGGTGGSISAPTPVGEWENITANGKANHVWEISEEESKAVAVVKGKVQTVHYLEMKSEGAGIAQFKVNVGGENWSNVEKLNFRLRYSQDDTDLGLTFKIETGEGEEIYKKTSITTVNSPSAGRWVEYEIAINGTLGKDFRSKNNNNWADDGPVLNLDNVKAFYLEFESVLTPTSLFMEKVKLVGLNTSTTGGNSSVISLIGSEASRTGIYALLNSEHKHGLKPNILIAPIYSSDKGHAEALQKVAAIFGGLAVCDRRKELIPSDNIENQFSGTDSSRVKITYPNLIMAEEGLVGYSAAWAGLRSEIDSTSGVNVSCSNRIIKGIESLEEPVQYIRGKSCEADDLSKLNVTTMIRDKGWRVWGGRTLADSSEADFSFVTWRRMGDLINETIITNIYWAIDNEIAEAFIEEVTDNVGDFLRNLVSQGKIYGGECWFDKDKNPVDRLKAGEIKFSYDFGMIPNAEKIIMESIVTDKYIEEIFS